MSSADQNGTSRPSSVALTPPTVQPSGRPPELPAGYEMITVTGGDRWLEAEAFVHDIYVSIGFTEPSPRRRVEELARWADNSTFHVIVDDQDHIVGTIRTIVGPIHDLPVGKFERNDTHGTNTVCELSSIVVDPNVRGIGLIEHLYMAGWRDAWRHGATAVVGIVDEWLYDAFRLLYRLPFEAIGEGREYMGGVPLPVSMPLHPEAFDLTATDNPGFWTWILENITAAEFLDWRLPMPATFEPSAPLMAVGAISD